MDLLRKELLDKRRSLAEESGGKRVFKRSQIQQRQLQKLREQEKRELEAKSLKRRSISSDIAAPTSSNSTAAAADVSLPNDEHNIDKLLLPKLEVIRRLRFLKQPITLFDEDDGARLDRLKHVLKTGLFEVDSDMTEGQTNDFLRDISELRKRQKTGTMSDRKRQKPGDCATESREGGDMGDDDDLSEGAGGSDADNDLKLLKANFEELCGEDKILVFFKKLLNEWKVQLLREMPEAKRRTADGKSLVARFKQCARYLNPLFKFCRNKILPDDIREALLLMVECFMKRDYQAAMSHYMKLAVGNAPWPIGVTMVGIHERSAREKIHTNSVAHIMNDETTRKYLQSVKRLMSICQLLYPTLPSKAFEFNSLANGGSDLKSLLAEDKNNS